MNTEEAKRLFKPITDKWHGVEIKTGEFGEPRIHDPLIDLNITLESALDIFPIDACIEEMDSLIRNGREFMNIKYFPPEGDIPELAF